MAFEAARNDGAVEIGVAILVTRTIYPTKLSPVGDWKFKELISFPVEKCLSCSSGTDYQAEAFRPRFGIRRYAFHCGLEKSVILFFHAEEQIWDGCFEHITAGCEAAED